MNTPMTRAQLRKWVYETWTKYQRQAWENEMSKDEIIKMAREAGVVIDANQSGFDSLVHFAALVAAAEREACAKVCEEDRWITGFGAADAIRARGEK